MRRLIGSDRFKSAMCLVAFFFVGVEVMSVIEQVRLADGINHSFFKKSISPGKSLSLNQEHTGAIHTQISGDHPDRQSRSAPVLVSLTSEPFDAAIHTPKNHSQQRPATESNQISSLDMVHKALKPGFAEESWQQPVRLSNWKNRFVSAGAQPVEVRSDAASEIERGRFRIIDPTTGETISEIPNLPEHYRFSGPHNLIYGTRLSKEARQRDLSCLSKAIYFEARGEPERGQKAVAQVIMNRVRNSFHPDTVCGVVLEGEHLRNKCQFSFACDGIPDVIRDAEKWREVQALAKKVFDGKIWLNEIGNANQYHASSVNPDWARTMRKITTIGNHKFYLRPEFERVSAR